MTLDRPSARRTGVLLVLLLLAGAALALIPSRAARADVLIIVTTPDDIVDGTDGVISMREAVTMASAAAQPVHVVVAGDVGALHLTRCDAATTNDDGNASGDLDYTGSQPLSLDGNSNSIDNSCADQRLFHFLGSGAATVERLDMKDGRGHDAGAILATHGLVVDTSIVDGTSMAPASSPTAAAVVVTGGDLTMVNARVESTSGGAGVSFLNAGGTVTLGGTGIVLNNSSPTGSAGGLYSAGEVHLTDSAVAQNTADTTPWQVEPGGHRAGGITVEPPHAAHLVRSHVDGNSGNSAGGIDGTVVMTDSTIFGNAGAVVGGLHGPITADKSRLDGNNGLKIGAAEATGTITHSFVSDNHGGEISGLLLSGPLTLQTSMVTANSPTVGWPMPFGLGGTGIGTRPGTALPADLVLDETTVAMNRGNKPPNDAVRPSQLSLQAGSLHARNSIIGTDMPSPGVEACAIANTAIVSDGHNFASDHTCGLTDPTDIHDGGDVRLHADGLPDVESPVLHLVPLGTAGCGGTDLYDRPRPMGGACDVGAVELQPAKFHAISPLRIWDTRIGAGGQAMAPGEERALYLPGSVTEQFATEAVDLNITVTNPTAPSHLSIYPIGESPSTSNLNFGAGQTIANHAIVRTPFRTSGSNLVVRNNDGWNDVIIDVLGVYEDGNRFSPSGGGDGFTPITPGRRLDTRTGEGGPAQPFGAGETRTLALASVGGMPADATAVVANVTATNATAASHLTVWPSNESPPGSSNLNWVAGETAANLTTARLSPSGDIDIRNNAGDADIIVDVVGYFRPGAGAYLWPMPAQRTLDTRVSPGGPAFGPGEQRRLGPGPHMPPSAWAAVFNLTAVMPSAATHLTAWPGASALPPTSNLNTSAHQTWPNYVISGVQFGVGDIDLRNNAGSTDVLVDLAGWFAP